VYRVDVNQAIPDRSVSIENGGIAPLGEARETHVFGIIRDVARKHKFTLSTPIAKIPEKGLNMILFGTEEGMKPDAQGFLEEPETAQKGWQGLIPLMYQSQQNPEIEWLRRWAEEYMTATACPECHGARLKKEALTFKLAQNHISEVADMDLAVLQQWVKNLNKSLSTQQKAIAKDIIKELTVRVVFLLDVGLDYLSLSRPSRTLSGGESQRIRLATQIGSQLVGVTYILDEPSIGLHQRDNERLIGSLRNLVDIGNTVLVVEHDKDIMEAADFLIDIGPRAGVHGGHVVAADIPSNFYKYNSITARYITGRDTIAVPPARRKGNGKKLTIKGATGNNLKNVSADFPLGKLICVTGVSGSGKSSLINETLYPILSQHFYNSLQKPLPYKTVTGLEHIDKVIEIDQSPIGRTPRSNPGTYIGVFSDIRNVFANLPKSKIRGYKPGRFSFNVKGGRCEECEGGGLKTIEMNFLPAVHVECPRCAGKRYNRETLEVRYKGKSIADVLDMTVEDAVPFFENIPAINRKIKTMLDVGLGYIKIGQQATTLSGGEAQRVKLSTELSKKDTGSTFYILDEPTTGLHFEDIRILMQVLNQLVDKGNTVLIIEHNMDVIKLADHIIDIGPEGGRGGGTVLFAGLPEELVKVKQSHTAKFLAKELKG
jgi:excinuclease ABC subunit A